MVRLHTASNSSILFCVFCWKSPHTLSSTVWCNPVLHTEMIRPIYFLRWANNWLKIFARLYHNFDKGSLGVIFAAVSPAEGNNLKMYFFRDVKRRRKYQDLFLWSWWFIQLIPWTDIEWGCLASCLSISTLTECALKIVKAEL